MAKTLVLEIQELAGKEGWDAMSDDLKKAIGSVPPHLEQTVLNQIRTDIKAKNGRVDLWGILDNFGSMDTLSQDQTATIPEPKPTAGTKTSWFGWLPWNKTKSGNKKLPAKMGGNFFGNMLNNKWVRWTLVVIVGVIVLIVISFFVSRSNSPRNIQPFQESPTNITPSSTESPTTFPEWTTIDAPEMTPLDFFSPEEPSMRLVITAISVLLIAYFGFMDAQKRDENGDATLTTIGLVIVIGGGLLFHALKEPLLINYMQFNQTQLRFVQVLYGGLLTILGFVLVYVACRQGRRDWTPMGSYLSLIGASGLFFATKGLGTIAIAFLAPESPSYSAVTLVALFWHQEFSQMWSSLIMYALLATGVWILGNEAYKSVLAAGDKDLFLAITGSVLFVVLYPIGRIFLNTVNPLWIYFVALGASAIMGGLNPQREERGGRATTPTGEGEERVGKPFIPPYDKLSWQISLLVFFIATTGAV